MSRIVGSGFELSGQADRTRLVGTKEIQGEAAQKGEVLGRIAQADLAGVLRALHQVSAYAAEYGLTLKQRTCEEKSNEITAIEAILPA